MLFCNDLSVFLFIVRMSAHGAGPWAVASPVSPSTTWSETETVHRQFPRAKEDMRKQRLRLVIPLAAGTVIAGALGRGCFPSAQADTPPADTTSAAEAQRVDEVPVKAPAWSDCPASWTDPGEGASVPPMKRTDEPRCATVEVPLDYDVPRGTTVKIALLKWSALKPSQKIGSLLFNPGGPGGSGTRAAALVETIASENLQNRFDIVGFDPRGVGKSTQMRCFTDTAAKNKALNRTKVTYPYTEKHTQDLLYLSETMARACSTTGKELASAMSTAEAARDMDVLRRVLGDEKLSYFGTSYGSVLGQFYANMFPDRFRAVAIDGITDARAWVGTAGTAKVPVGVRDGSAQAEYRAMKEAFKRCKAAGTSRCPFGSGNPEAAFETLLERLKKKPVTVQPAQGEPFTIDYEWALTTMNTVLRQPASMLDQMMRSLAKLEEMTAPTANDSAAGRRADQKALDKAVDDLRDIQKKNPGIRSLAETPDDYDSMYEAHYAVKCTDGKHASSARGSSRRRTPSIPCRNELGLGLGPLRPRRVDSARRGRLHRSVQPQHRRPRPGPR
jgi:pimeloyl-ACP methyl ester carboxylesterase